MEEDVCQQGESGEPMGMPRLAAELPRLFSSHLLMSGRRSRPASPPAGSAATARDRRIKEGVNVGIQHVGAVVGAVDEDALDCLLEAAPGAVAKGAIEEAGFKEGHQHIRHGALAGRGR